MKNAILMLMCISILLLISCENEADDDLSKTSWEVDLNSKNPVIESRFEDVGFKFCLLNENGKPATRFEKGDNFKFHFVLKNLSQEIILIDDNVFGGDFFTVYNGNSGTLIGKPWSGVFCEFVMKPEGLEIPVNDSLVISMPWFFTLEENKKNYYPFCLEYEHTPLPEDVYICQFGIDLSYKINNIKREVNELSFKINFEIE